MAHPHKADAEKSSAKKIGNMGGYSKRHQFDDHSTYDRVPPINTDVQRGLPPLNTPPELSRDTAPAIMRAHGGKARHRLDRHSRAKGGRTGKGKTQVNVIVAPHGGAQQGPTPVPVPVPRPVPVPAGPPPAAPPMGMGMGAMPPGIAPPPMGGGPIGIPRKKGGRVRGEEGNAKGKVKALEGNSFGKGGDGENPTPVIREEFGSAGGLGRLEKASRQAKAGKRMSKDNY